MVIFSVSYNPSSLHSLIFIFVPSFEKKNQKNNKILKLLSGHFFQTEIFKGA